MSGGQTLVPAWRRIFSRLPLRCAASFAAERRHDTTRSIVRHLLPACAPCRPQHGILHWRVDLNAACTQCMQQTETPSAHAMRRAGSSDPLSTPIHTPNTRRPAALQSSEAKLAAGAKRPRTRAATHRGCRCGCARLGHCCAAEMRVVSSVLARAPFASEGACRRLCSAHQKACFVRPQRVHTQQGYAPGRLGRFLPKKNIDTHTGSSAKHTLWRPAPSALQPRPSTPREHRHEAKEDMRS